LLSPWVKNEEKYSHVVSAMLTFTLCVFVVIVFFTVCFIHDRIEERKAAFTLTFAADLDKLQDGKTIRIDDYTVLGTWDQTGAVSSGTEGEYCVIGVLGNEDTEVRYIVLTDIPFSTLEVANINRHDPIVGTPLTLYHMPVQGVLEDAPALDEELRASLLSCLRDGKLSEAEPDGKLLPYNLTGTKMIKRKYLMMRHIDQKGLVWTLVIFTVLALISLVAVLNMRKKMRTLHQYYMETSGK